MNSAVSSSIHSPAINRARRSSHACLAESGIGAPNCWSTGTWSRSGGGTRLIVTNDVMHDEQWTAMATMGWTQQIGKLEKLLN